MEVKGLWLAWRGTAYAVPQYPYSTRFFYFSPSDEKTVIGLKVGGGSTPRWKAEDVSFLLICRLA